MSDIIYSYVMANNCDFTPCYDNNLWSLACCKPRIRRSVFKNGFSDDGTPYNNIWVVGVKHTKDKTGSKIEYIAKVTKVLRLEEYYNDNSPYSDRKDCVYRNFSSSDCPVDLKDETNPAEYIKNHMIKQPCAHTFKNPGKPTFAEINVFNKDINGKCVLLSDFFCRFKGDGKHFEKLDFIYKKCEVKRPGDFFYCQGNVEIGDLEKIVNKYKEV